MYSKMYSRKPKISIIDQERKEGIPAEQQTMSTTDTLLLDDIILEILTRLPAKSLTKQFRFVYQPWCDLMTNPSSNFIQTHLNRSIERDCPSFLSTIYCKRNTQFYSSCSSTFNDEEADAEHMFNPFLQIDIETDLLASCNGLVCLYNNSQLKLCLVNPCTRERKFLRTGKHLFADPYSAYGLGYDSVDDDYILVNIRRSLSIYDDWDSEVEVYSLNDYRDAICLLSFAAPYRILNGDIPGIYFNGSLHWVAVHEDRLETETIVSFDMKERNFQELLPTNLFKKVTSITGVGIMRGKLSMLCYFPTGDIEVWAMNKHGVMDSWTKQYAIEETVFPSICRLRSSIIDKDDDVVSRVIPLHFFDNGKILILDRDRLVIYDSKQKSARTLKIRGIDDAPLKIVSYIPSLVPLKSTNLQRLKMNMEPFLPHHI